ncbi:MAG: class I SAM-dependent methyltransferase [Parafilimonas sp.]|nr:class I SAM-dependent methyltransferase [Parafilimonas sp.]
MKEEVVIQHEELAAKAFNKQSAIFDKIYAENSIVAYKRRRVREHVLRLIPSKSKILELNAGTGDDAIFFATLGHSVHATDIAADMQQQLRNKVNQHDLNKLVSTELCSFTLLEKLQQKGPYDLIFSNFAGLNCTNELDKVLDSFDALLKPGGIATMVIMPRFCGWETMLAFKGNFKTAFRRLKSKNGTPANIEGMHFLCWYYHPKFLIQQLKGKLELLDVEGLCTLVPPSYFEKFPHKHSVMLRLLEKLESKLKRKWPWKYIGDYYIISFQKPAT